MPVFAALVHLLTASGALCALLATQAIVDRQAEAVFAWLGLALIIDGVDGPLARAAHVKDRLPRFSGERLDLVVDYLTYVFVPVLALIAWDYLGGFAGSALAAAILISSLYHFADCDSKAADNSFVGFPAIWNAVAFYIFALGLNPFEAKIAAGACVLLTFIPVTWVHPMRVVRLRWLTLAVSVIFAIAAAFTLWHGFLPPPQIRLLLILCLGYAFGISALNYFRR